MSLASGHLRLSRKMQSTDMPRPNFTTQLNLLLIQSARYCWYIPRVVTISIFAIAKLTHNIALVFREEKIWNNYKN
jgi:hypothetical protein